MNSCARRADFFARRPATAGLCCWPDPARTVYAILPSDVRAEKSGYWPCHFAAHAQQAVQ